MLEISIGYIISISICAGLSNGIETLCSQSFGALNFGQVGMWFNRGVAINLVFLVPSALLCIRMDLILLLFGQDQDIADGVGVYLRWSIPHLLLISIFISFCRLFQTTQNFSIISIITFQNFSIISIITSLDGHSYSWCIYIYQ